MEAISNTDERASKKDYHSLRKSLLPFYDNPRESKYDKRSKVLVYRNIDNEVVGGIRMMISRVGNDLPLPLEDIANVRVSDLACCGLKMVSYAEAGGIVVHPDFEGREIASLLYYRILEEAMDEKVKFVFSLAEKDASIKLASLPFTTAIDLELVTGQAHLNRKAGKESVLVCTDTHNLLQYFRKEHGQQKVSA